MILMTPLRREMGLKSLTLVGLCTLGISVMNELLMASRLRLPLKKSKHKVYVFFYNVPAFFHKESIETIGARGFVRRHVFDYLINVKGGKGPRERLSHFLAAPVLPG